MMRVSSQQEFKYIELGFGLFQNVDGGEVTLTITQTRLNDTGAYLIRITNEWGLESEGNASLLVKKGQFLELVDNGSSFSEDEQDQLKQKWPVLSPAISEKQAEKSWRA